MTTLAQALDLAAKRHQAGNLQQAEELYHQVLRLDPRHVDAWHRLGLIAGQSGKYDLARECFRNALQLKPDHAEAHNNLGNVLGAQQQLEQAAASYREAIRHKPNIAGPHFNLGNILRDQGKLDEAVASYHQAHCLSPEFAEAHHNLAVALCDQGKLDEALASSLKAVRLQPNNAAGYFNHGNILRRLGKLDEAAANYQQALRCRPDYAQAHNNLGMLLREQDKLDEALSHVQEALRLKPDNAEAHVNLAIILQDQGRLDEALVSIEEALRLRPNLAAAHNNLALLHQEEGKLDQAQAGYQEAIRLQPDYADAHFNLARLLLLQGNYVAGWREYEWRLQLKRLAMPSYPQPRWDGSPLLGKTILLHAEQGLGDTLQFIRFALLVKEQGGTVLLKCPAELAGVLCTCAGIDLILTPNDPVPSFDVHAPLLSLPAILKTTLATVPATVPYLSAEPALIKRWQQELNQHQEFRIGIIWQGNPRFSQRECRAADRRRSIPLAQFEPLAHVPGVRLFSLQKGYGTEQLADWQTRLGLIDLGDRLTDFADTAAVMMNLDLVIAADTAPVHLAGALGRPVWTVLPWAGCWRWLLNRAGSPWYPAMRLFRQQRPGDWSEVFQRIVGDVLRVRDLKK